MPKTSKASKFIAEILYWTAKVFLRFRVQPPFTDNDWHRKPNAILYLGYWQNKEYVQSVELPSFRKDLELGQENEKIISLMNQTNSVAVHVRRGDYTDPKIQHIYGNIGTLEFYHKAIDIIKSKVDKPHFSSFQMIQVM